MLNIEAIRSEIPKVKDLLDMESISAVLNDAKGLAIVATQKTFGKARKIPMGKNLFQRYLAVSCLLGEIKAIERLMTWLENGDGLADHFDPEHDLIQFLYGELCMYILKLDKMLYLEYGIVSSINKKVIEERTEIYLKRYYDKIKNIRESEKTVQ